MENKQNLLTIIVPIYQPKKDISAILKNLTKQKNQNFDVIILIDKPNDNELEAIKKYKQNIGNRLKLIINSSHQHISIVLRQAFTFVKTEYSYIFYSYSYINSEFTNHIINFINKSVTKPDFIELNGYCRGLVHYDFYRDKFQNEKIINYYRFDCFCRNGCVRCKLQKQYVSKACRRIYASSASRAQCRPL